LFTPHTVPTVRYGTYRLPYLPVQVGRYLLTFGVPVTEGEACRLRLAEPLLPDELGVTGLRRERDRPDPLCLLDPDFPDWLGVDRANGVPDEVGVTKLRLELEIPDPLGV
jgi:hypothetical protein